MKVETAQTDIEALTRLIENEKLEWQKVEERESDVRTSSHKLDMSLNDEWHAKEILINEQKRKDSIIDELHAQLQEMEMKEQQLHLEKE